VQLSETERCLFGAEACLLISHQQNFALEIICIGCLLWKKIFYYKHWAVEYFYFYQNIFFIFYFSQIVGADIAKLIHNH